MPDLLADLLAAPVEISARRIVLGWIADLEAAGARLSSADDGEALHDVRVAVRRLRSLLRAYHGSLRRAAGRKARRRLAEIASATGAARDAEVLAGWLRRERAELDPGDPGAESSGALLALLERRRASAAPADLAARVEDVVARLRRRLPVTDLRIDAREPWPARSFGAVTAELVKAAAADLAARLAAVQGADDVLPLHQARIAGKRLRYLLEPVRDKVGGAGRLVETLKRAQDLFGELHDLHVLAGEIDGFRPAAPQSLAALEARVRGDIEARFTEVEHAWLGEAAAPTFAAIDQLAAELAGRLDTEVERKYLLRGLPEAARGAPAAEIQQGYLPGERLRERVRRQVDGRGERCWRTVKLGKGVVRVEIEEPTSREIFDALYRLTEGHRVHKRRYRVADGDRTWEIDEFLDRELVLAEIELHAEDEKVELPEWLAPLVEREVTDEPGYVNLNLAK